VSWLRALPATSPVAHAVGVLALVCLAGLAIGTVKIRGIGLGVAGVLFAGIVVAHFGRPVDKSTLDFVRDFGLILFVFMIGLQLGPGFFATFRKQGMKMNALAVVVVLLGTAVAIVSGWAAGFDPAAVLGVFAGGSVNMPSLGAATDALAARSNFPADRLALPALACAVTFPTAIVSSIGALLLIRKLFGIDPRQEAEDYAASARASVQSVERRTLVVTNPKLDGLRIDQLSVRDEAGVTISGVRHGSETRAATAGTVIHLWDQMAVVGTSEALDRFEGAVGTRAEEDLAQATGPVTYRRVVVTDRAALGKSIKELNLDDRFDVVMTRIERAGVEMTARPGLRLQFGDVVLVVGHDKSLDHASAALGNSLKELNETHFIPLYLGIVLGVAVGTFPIALPWMPLPLRLGLAGGPLIVALVLGRLGRIGPLVCYMPANANLAFREFGVALFFAAVGLDAGAKFFSTVFSAAGVKWLVAGASVAIIPILVIGIAARMVWHMNFIDLSGLLAGSSTNPTALSFAIGVSGSDAPTVAYATVYPLAMLLRVLSAQVLALSLVR
jgi:putative transport protein